MGPERSQGVSNGGRNDFCFDPRNPQIEVLSGGARFGNTFDDFGNRFICNIRNPVQHVVLPLHEIEDPDPQLRKDLRGSAAVDRATRPRSGTQLSGRAKRKKLEFG